MIVKGPWINEPTDIFYAAESLLGLYGRVFALEIYLQRFSLPVLDTASKRFAVTCFGEVACAEEKFSCRLRVLFGEDEKVRPLRIIPRPLRALSIRDIHLNKFEDAEHIQVFLEGHEVVASRYDSIDSMALVRAMACIEAMRSRIRSAALDYLDSGCHALPGLLQHALAYEYGTRATASR
ncbi:hypothetical protein [Pseudomonas fluorescens]|uniref:hypothetical protein n=1 Tax=Pseudomonas fluorescens TaxID=294 RepID=UPI0012DB0638|nr:hypothetical protein [Pseudomonas fluorescens]